VGEVTVGFTPGPWETVEAFYKNGFYVFGKERGQGWLRKKRLDDCGAFKNEADARLIAAAPELYGQLESGQTDLDLLRRAIEENDPKAELLIRVTDLWKRNDAALAKARGEA
jgi:hypothetical protein